MRRQPVPRRWTRCRRRWLRNRRRPVRQTRAKRRRRRQDRSPGSRPAGRRGTAGARGVRATSMNLLVGGRGRRWVGGGGDVVGGVVVGEGFGTGGGRCGRGGRNGGADGRIGVLAAAQQDDEEQQGRDAYGQLH